jgi:hypothetical protein
MQLGMAASGPLVVVEGKARSVPTAYCGVVRIRALPTEEAQPGRFRLARNGEARIVLEVAAEPGLPGWQFAGPSRIATAIDNQGQNLTIVDEPDAATDPDNLLERALIRSRLGNRRAVLSSGSRQTAIYLKLGDKRANSLTELTGSLSLKILTPSAPLVAADNVFNGRRWETVSVSFTLRDVPLQ